MIIGVGVDLIEVARIRASHERFGERFLKRILRPGEIEYCLSNRDPAPFLAARFAAKEAVSKAFGTGIGARLGWQDMEVRRYETGQPFMLLHEGAQDLVRERGAQQIHLSLSHTTSHATAIAIIEG